MTIKKFNEIVSGIAKIGGPSLFLILSAGSIALFDLGPPIISNGEGETNDGTSTLELNPQRSETNQSDIRTNTNY